MMATRTLKIIVAAVAAAASMTVWGAERQTFPLMDSMPIASGRYMTIPLQTWNVDAKSFIATLRNARVGTNGSTTKAATDRATVYRPIAVCRLIDTRGLAAAITVAGPLAPGSSTFVNSAGFCGIPNNGEIAGISLSFHVWNHTVNNGGFITFLQQDVSTTPVPPGVNAVFNEGSTWTAATANVSIPNDSGNFKIYIANSSVDVIVDVNGYYQDLDNLDVGSQELDITGAAVGDLFELTNLDVGSALTAGNFANGPAFTITSGSVKASGAGVDTPTFAFIHRVTAASLCGGDTTYSVIDNLLLNGDSGAIALVTPRFNPNDVSAVQPAVATPMIEYRPTNTCTNSIPAARWFLRTPSLALITNSYYNVLVIKP
jgi:hypothetical protein